MRVAFRPLAFLLTSAVSSSRAFTPLRSARFMTSLNSSKATSADMLRVALCQFKVSENKEKNQTTCKAFIEKAASKGAQLVVLPEIWASSYATAAFPEQSEILPGVGDEAGDSPSARILQEASIQHKLWIVGGSIAEKDGEKIYNTCLIYSPEGKVVAKHRKVHLFDIDVPGGITFFESDTLSPGESVTSFDTPWSKIGVGICYDIRFMAYSAILQQQGCKILIFPGAFNMTTGPAHWELLQRARAVDNQCFILTASPARTNEPDVPGKYPHYTAWGHSTAVSPWGEVLATTDEKEDIVVVDLDLSLVDQMRTSIPIFQQQRTDLYKVEGI